MRNRAGIPTSAIAVALAVAGCGNPTAKPPPTPTPPPVAPKITFNYPVPKTCPAGTTPGAGQSYGIRLGGNFKLTAPVVGKTGNNAMPKHPPPHPTKLDIVTNILQAGQPGTVTITLSKASKLSFAQPDLAFAGADDEATKIFCGPMFGTNSQGEATLTFTVLANPSAPYGSYILGLVAADQDPLSKDTLPIFIDPGVDNDGFV